MANSRMYRSRFSVETREKTNGMGAHEEYVSNNVTAGVVFMQFFVVSAGDVTYVCKVRVDCKYQTINKIHPGPAEREGLGGLQPPTFLKIL